MPSLEEYKIKLRSLSNTEKMTQTMKLVSASKLRQTHHAQANARTYAKKLTGILSRLVSSTDPSFHPLLKKSTQTERALVLLFTSDKGLCGGFNNNLQKRVWSWLQQDAPIKTDVSACGKKGFLFFRNHRVIRNYYEGATSRFDFSTAKKIGHDLEQSFLSNSYQEVYLAYNRFNSPLSQTPVIEKLLPIDSQSLAEGNSSPFSFDYLFEPEREEVLKAIIENFFYFKIYYTLLENAAGEHAARTTAMDKASQNVKELIKKFIFLRNRARQAAITKELIEILSGAEPLKNK